MTDLPDGVDLTRKLVSFDTINPPGNEAECLRYLGGLLEGAGFTLHWHDWQPGRPNLVARLDATGPSSRAPLVFSGHLDTVPLGQAAWSVDPFSGEIRDGRLYGRGTSDMKSGVAACVIAAMRLAQEETRGAETVLVLTSGEETGCEGALALAESGLLDAAGALIVAEPTDNRPLVGHKGALWLSLTHSGITAHGSMPERGRNAIFAACDTVALLRGFPFAVEAHGVMGAPSINLGTLAAGMNINSVPDMARLGVDIRTIVGQSNAEMRETLQALVGEDVAIETLTDMDHVFTDPEDPWLAQALGLAGDVLGAAPEIATATYFTDASVLKPAMGDPATLIMGPGVMAMAHQTDEYVETARMTPCIEAFTRIGKAHLA